MSIYIPPFDILETQDIKYIRQEIRKIEDSLKFCEDLLHGRNDVIVASLKPFKDAMRTLLTDARDHLIKVEMQTGCIECGAQMGEDCRLSSDVGYCVSWEEDKDNIT